MKPRILLDMDGVIANFYTEFARFLNEQYGCSLDPEEDPINYSLGKWGHGIENVPIDQASLEWIRNHGFKKVSAYPGATEFVKNLSNIANIFIVTARIGDWQEKFDAGVLDIIKNDTKQWLLDNNMPFDKLFFEHNKIDFCIKNSIQIMIEDKMSTALEASKNGISTILMNRGYNGSKIDRFRIYRVYNFNEALSQLEKLHEL